MVDNSEAVRATVLDLKAMKRVTYENQWAMESISGTTAQSKDLHAFLALIKKVNKNSYVLEDLRRNKNWIAIHNMKLSYEGSHMWKGGLQAGETTIERLWNQWKLGRFEGGWGCLCPTFTRLPNDRKNDGGKGVTNRRWMWCLAQERHWPFLWHRRKFIWSLWDKEETQWEEA